MPDSWGPNPLDFIAVGKVQDTAWNPVKYHLFEKAAMPNSVGGYRWVWVRYGDHADPVNLPRWLADPAAGYVTPLSCGAKVYDYNADEGHKNIGRWIDDAAQKVGR